MSNLLATCVAIVEKAALYGTAETDNIGMREKALSENEELISAMFSLTRSWLIPKSIVNLLVMSFCICQRILRFIFKAEFSNENLSSIRLPRQKFLRFYTISVLQLHEDVPHQFYPNFSTTDSRAEHSLDV